MNVCLVINASDIFFKSIKDKSLSCKLDNTELLTQDQNFLKKSCHSYKYFEQHIFIKCAIDTKIKDHHFDRKSKKSLKIETIPTKV